MNIFSKYFSTLFGIGYIPIAPGTFGSIFAIIIWYIFINFISFFYFIILFIIIFSVSFFITGIYLDKYKKKIPPSVEPF
jgi:Phosphatidylglycerophosphatase A.